MMSIVLARYTITREEQQRGSEIALRQLTTSSGWPLLTVSYVRCGRRSRPFGRAMVRSLSVSATKRHRRRVR